MEKDILEYYQVEFKKNSEAIVKEKIQEMLIGLRKSGDYERDAKLQELIRAVGEI